MWIFSNWSACGENVEKCFAKKIKNASRDSFILGGKIHFPLLWKLIVHAISVRFHEANEYVRVN